MSSNPHEIVKGVSSRASPLTADLLRADSRPLEFALRSVGNYFPRTRRVAFGQYLDPAFAAIEKDRLWKKVWQCAGRQEDIPQVGDRLVYTVADMSFVVVRSAPSEFRAFRNSCLHRGTRLCDGVGSGQSLRCPFHGWEWNLDGSLRNIPSRWDFPGVTSTGYRLSQVQVGTWDGFLFINPDPDAPALEATLGVLRQHFSDWRCAERFTAVHIRKLVRANWKVTLEAFLEAYHVIETHADALGFTGDSSTQYDIWEDGTSHVSRLITPSVVPSPHLGDEASIEAAANEAFGAFSMATSGAPVPKFDSSSPLSARGQVAAWRRETLALGFGRDFSARSDASMVDSIQYYMFPNFCPWWGEGLPLVYQFLPNGNDPSQSVMGIRLLLPVPGVGPQPPSAAIKHLGFDEPFSSVGEIGILARIFDQDMGNLPRIQAGLSSAADEHAFQTLGRYQEQRIRHFHEVLEETLGL
jgi:phenylpropionate dioxygenase-like ring-hydroxylating dioxygenase large terminal subunit